MKKLASLPCSIEDKLSLFLLQYRTTPNCTTGQSPADLFLHRHVRTRLDFLKPNTKETVRKKQYQQKDQHDYSAENRTFEMDEYVYLRNTAGGAHKWIPGQVVRQTGPVSYQVKERDSDTVHRRHGDQLRARASPEQTDIDTETFEAEMQNTGNDTPVETTVDLPVQPSVPPEPPSVTVRRSERVRKKPNRYLE
ncbi:unnamed protein product [Knipowitschia caucasica]|uniref:Uncharacterized protein n=1 Tax=Knipowitschia caucasica TaxID=637954 RepID=A0AAV2J420_KNICA